MSMELFLTPSTGLINADDARQIDERVDQMIAEFRDSEVELTKMVMESTSLSTATKSRAQALAEQGACKRFLGWLTGKNRRVRDMNDRDLAHAQYMAQKTMVRLAEQNALTMNMVVAVRNQVNMIAGNLNHLQQNVAQLWSNVGRFAQAVADRLELVESRLQTLEHENRLDAWANTINVSEFRGVRYKKLDTIPKLVCVVNDFHVETRGKWRAVEDWKRLRAVLDVLGLDYEEDVVLPRDFIRTLAEDALLMERLFNRTGVQLASLESPVYSPILFGLSKMHDFSNGESYVVDTALSVIPAESSTPEKIALELSCNYVTRLTDASLTEPIPVDDFCRSLLIGLSMMRPAVEDNDARELSECIETEDHIEPCDYDLVTDLFNVLIEAVISKRPIERKKSTSNFASLRAPTFVSNSLWLGYASSNDDSLEYLGEPIKEVEIDQSFLGGILMNPVGVAVLLRFFQDSRDIMIYSAEGELMPEAERLFSQLFYTTSEIPVTLKWLLPKAVDFGKNCADQISWYLTYGGTVLFYNLLEFNKTGEVIQFAHSLNLQSLLKVEEFLGMVMRFFSRDPERVSKDLCFAMVNDLMRKKPIDEERAAYFSEIWKNHVEGWEEELASI